ncbi:hypothetical protein B484DRAFT_446819 [Ochromonadaceae sp. CCMP2298]|nr:hypothetical protein B484DRAFT_446819 [Ochromonadaceae sp. CCMP2298]
MLRDLTVMPEEAMMQKTHSKAHQPKWRRSLFKKMNAPLLQVFLGLLLMLSLFMAESWILGNAPDSANAILYSILSVVFAIFAFETVALSVVQEGYFNSFFFWMDVIGTISILLDIGWVADTFIPTGAVTSTGNVLRATRAAKLGARYGRLMRLMRLMKLTHYLPCFASAGEDTFEPTMSAIKKVSEELSSMLSLRTAALVMILVITVPFLSYTQIDYSPNAWVDNFKMAAKNETVSAYTLSDMARQCQNFYGPKDPTLLYLRVQSPYQGEFEETYDTRDTMRKNNILEYSSSYFVSNVKYGVNIHIDNTVVNQANAMYGILLIVLVILVLVVFTAAFSSAVNRKVVQPLEKMMSTLRNSAMLMITSLKQLQTTDEAEEDAKELKEKEKKKERRGDTYNSMDDDDNSDTNSEASEDLDSAMLEKMVEKLNRIVKHILPKTDIDIEGAGIDKGTSNWLSQAYSQGPATRKVVHAARLIGKFSKIKALSQPSCVVTRQQLDSWEFDVLAYTQKELCGIMAFMFSCMNLLSEFDVPGPKLEAFLQEISGRYLMNTYHNFNHGCDVAHTSYRLMEISQLHTIFTSLEVFSVLVGALAHDVGHPGLNNLFLVKAQHELALRHNDRSPLENMHCVQLYEVLSHEETNIFVNLSSADWREARKIILTIILGTDMSHHFEQISKTQLFLEVNGEDTKSFSRGEKDVIDCFADDKNRIFIMELVLHCSDISNPFKPYDICAKWADLVVEEFCLQGDKEKNLGMEVSPMCDRDAISLCNMQMGFIEFVVAPLIIAFVSILPALHGIGANMQNNFQQWGEKRLGELMPEGTDAEHPEEAVKLQERLGKFRDRMAFVLVLQAEPTRRKLEGELSP